MERKNIGNNAFILPEPVTIVGTKIEGRANFMTVAWVTRTNYQPCQIAIAIHREHATTKGVLANGEFSINLPSQNMVRETDVMGLLSGKRVDKSRFFDIHYGELENAPLITDCPLSLELRLVGKLEQPSNWLLVGELVAAWTRDEYLTDGYVDIEKVQPFTLSMPDNRYWAVGEMVGRAWHEGKPLKDKVKNG
ncbi:flavin reductase family protein [Salidesulfovibrio brasiliensis]